MPSFEILEHTADIGVRAYGADLAELFANAALAVESIAVDLDRVEPRQAYPLSANGEDIESLLVNWLNEVIYYLDGKRIALVRFDVNAISETAVSAQAFGEPRHPARHPAQLVVKAATYHELRVANDGTRWSAEVYLDI